jgi:phosphomevalonate kinase
MSTSLVAALLHFFGCIRVSGGRLSDSDSFAEDRRILHNVAQLAHSVAQGKVGSGFDVSAAVYGTQIYRRFDPVKTERMFSDISLFSIAADGGSSPPSASKATPGALALASSRLYEFIADRSEWTEQRTQFKLPRYLDVVLGDVCGGSSSASMVITFHCPEHPRPSFSSSLSGFTGERSAEVALEVPRRSDGALVGAVCRKRRNIFLYE